MPTIFSVKFFGHPLEYLLVLLHDDCSNPFQFLLDTETLTLYSTVSHRPTWDLYGNSIVE